MSEWSLPKPSESAPPCQARPGVGFSPPGPRARTLGDKQACRNTGSLPTVRRLPKPKSLQLAAPKGRKCGPTIALTENMDGRLEGRRVCPFCEGKGNVSILPTEGYPKEGTNFTTWGRELCPLCDGKGHISGSSCSPFAKGNNAKNDPN